MIPYTLAKEMKENGYPMRRTCECVQDICVHQNYPTLEEVIEALGERFYKLERHSLDLFEAYSRGGSITYRCDGPTPLIAACNLWLVINRKQHDQNKP